MDVAPGVVARVEESAHGPPHSEKAEASEAGALLGGEALGDQRPGRRVAVVGVDHELRGDIAEPAWPFVQALRETHEEPAHGNARVPLLQDVVGLLAGRARGQTRATTTGRTRRFGHLARGPSPLTARSLGRAALGLLRSSDMRMTIRAACATLSP